MTTQKNRALYINASDADLLKFISSQRKELESWQDCARRLLREYKQIVENRGQAKAD